MDFLEIQSFCGFDLEKADEMAKGYPPIEYTPELLDEMMMESGID